VKSPLTNILEHWPDFTEEDKFHICAGAGIATETFERPDGSFGLRLAVPCDVKVVDGRVLIAAHPGFKP
jgi:CTP-dependent riboflavin kinase